MVLKHIIFKILQKLDLSIRKNNPRGFIKYAKDYFKRKKLIGAEVGTQYGVNARYILKLLNIKKIYLIDPYINYEDSFDGKIIKNDFSDGKERAIKKLKKFKNKIEWIYKTSEDAVEDIEEKLDFAYIDGNHQYEYVKKDIKNFWKKLKKGGILAGHDLPIYSVAKAVVEFANKNKLQVLSRFKDGEWIIIK